MSGLPMQWLLPAIVAVAASGTPARAELPADAVANLDKAATDFVALLKDPAYKASPPRLTDDKAKLAFAALFDRETLLGTAPYRATDMQPLLSVFSGYFTLTKVYIEAKDAEGKPTPGNELTYQDELTQFGKAMLASGGAISEALTDQAKSKLADQFSEEEKARLAKLRLGVSQVFSSTISLVQNPEYSKENKVVLTQALAANGEAFRDIITVAERANISSAAAQAIMYAPKDIEQEMTAFIDQLKSEDCTGLCALK